MKKLEIPRKTGRRAPNSPRHQTNRRCATPCAPRCQGIRRSASAGSSLRREKQRTDLVAPAEKNVGSCVSNLKHLSYCCVGPGSIGGTRSTSDTAMTTRASGPASASRPVILRGILYVRSSGSVPTRTVGRKFQPAVPLVAHVQNAVCKRVMMDPVTLASFLQMTDRWKCDTCRKTWSQRTVICSCPQQSPRPLLPIQSPALLAPDTYPPPAPANALPTLERVLCTPVVTMTHIPKPLSSEVDVAWASLAQNVANQNASLEDFTRPMIF
jgi:hypothetical protein